MSVADIVGNTPIVALENINPNPSVKIFAKLEGNNPAGSSKDRIAYYMIVDAEKNGRLKKDHIILEPTSGNTGIGLAMMGAAKGYRVKLVMPECVSMERRKTIEAFGAELILSPGTEKTDGAIALAHKIYQDSPDKYFMPDQFNNPSNVKAHYETTGIEVYQQTQGQVSVFVAGMGTTGTLMGVSKRLKEYDQSIQIIGVEPVLGHKIQGLKNMTEAIVPGIYDPSRLDEKITVYDDEAFDTTRALALKEGLLVGMSSGAAVYIAIQKAKTLKDGVIVVILPDRGDRYLSAMLFTSVCAKCPP
jgi:cysteine synthase B